MVSELHSRLEHLVNYSSQLIFVSGDKISQQTQIIDAFLGHQSENAEVAIVAASEVTTQEQYRYQLQKQLIPHKGANDDSLPLNQLLSPLNEYDGPVLISISNAEHLPQKILQELWELVLQSRFAANKQHLNVLLFADPLWAEQAKAWLPANSANKPILLSNQSVFSSEPLKQLSDLDKLIASKREAFSKRMNGRAQHYEPIRPVLASPRLVALLLVVFSGVFLGILGWQYPDIPTNLWSKLSNKMAAINSQALSTDSTQSQDEQIEKPSAQQNTSELKNTSISAGNSTENNISLNDGNDQEPELTYSNSSNELVTDWQSAIANIDKNAAEEKLAVTTQLDEQINQSSLESNGSPSNTQESSSDDVVYGSVDDYQVEDITSVEQLTITNQQTSAFTSEQTQTLPSNERKIIEIDNTVIEKYEFDETLLVTLPQGQYLIQIAGMGDIQTMREFVEDNQIRQELWIYKTQRVGSDWYVLLHNKSYPTLAAARLAIDNLSSVMLQGTPFAKTTGQVLTELQ